MWLRFHNCCLPKADPDPRRLPSTLSHRPGVGQVPGIHWSVSCFVGDSWPGASWFSVDNDAPAGRVPGAGCQPWSAFSSACLAFPHGPRCREEAYRDRCDCRHCRRAPAAAAVTRREGGDDETHRDAVDRSSDVRRRRDRGRAGGLRDGSWRGAEARKRLRSDLRGAGRRGRAAGDRVSFDQGMLAGLPEMPNTWSRCFDKNERQDRRPPRVQRRLRARVRAAGGAGEDDAVQVDQLNWNPMGIRRRRRRSGPAAPRLISTSWSAMPCGRSGRAVQRADPLRRLQARPDPGAQGYVHADHIDVGAAVPAWATT